MKIMMTMTHKTILVALVFGLSFATAQAFANPPFSEMVQGVTVDVAPTRVFIPQGFDNNDPHVQIVLEGELPSTCYDIGDTTFTVDAANHKVYLRQQANYYSGNAWCDNSGVQRPYVHVVDLKTVAAAGDYQVLVTNPDSAQPVAVGMLPIAATTNPNPDDFLYAPVMDAHLVRDRSYADDPKRLPVVVMQGTFKNSCMHLKEIKVNVRRNHVIEVLPVAEMGKEICNQVQMPFDERVELPRVPKGRYLIHIRSLNSESVNKVLDL